ncbi:E3 ubiquitin-protein ligase-like isoform X2 [Epinephelus fuscoguttatus]|uniref:E3 ubiquitin-protein ligase-like isoform X2 n=1 Tax=Epinephelus fuscoguttatus TaxID=293821 RepID=UPI0020D122A6|nr:E3 ubiquitin-protein ligase-like isoform X2 [Epinephelus fuscoguttatus]
MYSEHECGICYQTYNAGLRCPRKLHCHHSFCESCLLALSRPQAADQERLGAERVIVCPLCRHTTTISGERKVRAELRVDECVLEELVLSGVLDREEEEEEEEDIEEAKSHVQTSCDDTEELYDLTAEESDFSSGSRGGRLRRSCWKVWRMIIGKNSRRRDRENFMNSDDLRNFAMMSCNMF